MVLPSSEEFEGGMEVKMEKEGLEERVGDTGEELPSEIYKK